jgi:hypothetical protein
MSLAHCLKLLGDLLGVATQRETVRLVVAHPGPAAIMPAPSSSPTNPNNSASPSMLAK